MTDMDMVMAAGFVISVLVLATVGMWQDWHKNTREFREMRRRMMQAQEDRRGGEKK